MLLNLFNPELVILTGEGVRMGDILLDPMRRSIEAASFGLLGLDTQIVVEELGDEAWAQGAASIVVHELLRPPIYESRLEDPLTHFLGRGETSLAEDSRQRAHPVAVKRLPSSARPQQPRWHPHDPPKTAK